MLFDAKNEIFEEKKISGFSICKQYYYTTTTITITRKKNEANQKTILWMALVTKKAKKPAAQCGNLGEKMNISTKNNHFTLRCIPYDYYYY